MEDCLFCKIVNNEIPSTKVYEDEDVLAFRDTRPLAPIHILVIPKKHIESLVDLKEEDEKLIGKLMVNMRVIAEKLGIDKDGFRVITNCGENGGQEVKHLHFHILAGKKLGTKII